MKLYVAVVFFFLSFFPGFDTVTGQTRDDVNSNGNRPRDTTKPKPPRYINVDTTRPVPVETKTLVRSVLKLKRIIVTKDALAICRILNADIYQHDSTLSNHTIILPELPDLPKDLRRSLKDKVKADSEPDGSANIDFVQTALRFDTLANLFSVSDLKLNGNDRSEIFKKVKVVLPPLARNAKQASGKTRKKSGATVRTLNSAVNSLNKMLRSSIDSGGISVAQAQKIYNLMFDVNILVSSIDDEEIRMDSSLVAQKNGTAKIFLAASYSLLPPSEKALAGDDDPSRFNIYIFRNSLLSAGDRDPEMDMYTVSYAIPALADDPTAWQKIQKPASTTGASFPPARFTFSVKDNRTGKVYYSTEDLYNAQKDPDEKWTIMDWIDPHPVYRIMFLIP